MGDVPARFRAFRIHDDSEGYRAGVEEVGLDDLASGNVTIRVAWSGLNYKDALAATGQGRILRRAPLVGGIDVAGTVVESDSDEFLPGEKVLANGSGLSETRDGGFTEYLRLPANIVEPNAISFSDIFVFPGTMRRRSQASASMQPPATAWPFSAATSGFG